MRTIRYVTLTIAAVLAMVGIIFLAQRYFRPAGPKPAETAALAATDWQDAPALPALSLQIGHAHELDVFQGTPLIFTVRVTNPRALNAAAIGEEQDAYRALIQAKVARGEIKPKDAQPMLERAQRKPQVTLFRIETADRGWQSFVHFEVVAPGGKPETLNWPLRLVATTAFSDLTSAGQLDYALSPEAAVQVTAGAYAVIAVLEIPAETLGPPDLWHGRVASPAVDLTILPMPARPSPAQRGQLNLARAEFFSITKDWKEALASAQAALAADRSLIRAEMVAGDAKEAQGDLSGARDAFVEAKRLFDEQNPNSYEAPEDLITKIAELDQRLRIRPGR